MRFIQKKGSRNYHRPLGGKLEVKLADKATHQIKPGNVGIRALRWTARDAFGKPSASAMQAIDGFNVLTFGALESLMPLDGLSGCANGRACKWT